MEEVTCWKTTDGKIFEDAMWAERHEAQLGRCALANKFLKEGNTVGDVLSAVNYAGEIDPILDRVTRETKLVISHWQCSDKAEYRPALFQTNMSIHVCGGEALFGGTYGDDIPIRELARYARDKRTIFGDA